MNSENSKTGAEAFVPDAPLSTPDEDLFDRWPFASRIANAIISRSDPSSIVVGIYGAWGEGKTTVLNFVDAELRKAEHIICMRFNPWRFNDEGQLLLCFFSYLADQLGKSLSTQKEKVGDFLKKYASMVAPLSVSFLGVGFSPGRAAEEVGKRLSEVDIEELRQRIEAMIEEAGKRVVVLMDDIDRLDKSEIYAVFRLVKLTADFKHTAYVLAFDDVMVANALLERYASGRTESGYGFLEKIVQVPLNLPQAEQISLRQLCFEGVERALNDSSIALNDEQVQTFVRHFIDGLEIRLKTPRMCKRYANALSFALPILKGEANPVDLMLVEGIRVFYPQIYATIRDNPSAFHGAMDYSSSSQHLKDTVASIIFSATNGLPEKEVECAKDLLKTLFPKVSGVLGDISYGSDWHERWAKEQRVCSPEYFTRYFTYAVPKGDISDTSVKDFLDSIEGRTAKQVSERLRSLINSRNAGKLISKLREREKDLSPNDSIVLAKALTLIGGVFPNPEQLFSFRNAWSQAAILVHWLLLNIKDPTSRLETAKDLLHEATPLSFGVECLKWMRSSDDDPQEKRSFDTTGEDALGAIVAERVRDEARSKNLYTEYHEDARFLLWVWSRWGKAAEVDAYLLATFENNPENVVEFLKTFLPTAWGMETGISHKSDFERSQYDSVASLINPQAIYDHLAKVYGHEIEEATTEKWEYRDYPIDKKVALQFVALHKYVTKQKENSQQENAPDGEPTSGFPAGDS
ncbi:MAG: KAP family P-loop domain protein [Deltaproteobacteria bacterium ADurb.Bin151]|nr:MAG: KAP family P-loop domain protein [Deltaproteobacteria bacterium ADurb.Bin151]